MLRNSTCRVHQSMGIGNCLARRACIYVVCMYVAATHCCCCYRRGGIVWYGYGMNDRLAARVCARSIDMRLQQQQ